MPKEQSQMSPEVEAAIKAEVSARVKAVIGGEAGTNGASSIHVDAPLSDYSMKIVQEDDVFRAREIVSNFNRKHRSDQFYYYEPAYFIVNQVVERAEGTEAAMAKYGVKRKDYSTVVYALKQPVTDETLANPDSAIDSIFEDVTAFITRQFLLNKEKKLAEALMVTGVWGTEYTGQAAALSSTDLLIENGKFQKFTQATSKPLDVMDKTIEQVHLVSGMRPNTVVMTRTVFSALKRHSTIKTTKLYTNPNSGSKSAVLDTIASHLDIEPSRIFVLDVVTPAQNVTIDGNTYAITTDTEGLPSTVEGDDSTRIANEFIGGNGILFMYIDMNSNGRYQATAAVCAQWTDLYPDGGAMGNTVFKRYREERLSSTMVEGRTAFKYLVTAPSLGGFLADVI